MKGLTDTWGQGVIPGSPFTCHTLQTGGPVQSVSGLTSVCDAAAREMTLVIDLEAKLRHTWVLAVGQLKTCEETEKDRRAGWINPCEKTTDFVSLTCTGHAHRTCIMRHSHITNYTPACVIQFKVVFHSRSVLFLWWYSKYIVCSKAPF